MRAGVLRPRTWLTVVVATALAAAAAGAAAPDPCFGAAARDHARMCHRTASSLDVTPDPAVADSLPGAPCHIVERRGDMSVCAFGLPPERAVGTVALVGDSHAAHWRGALEVVARAYGWRALSIMRSSCPLSKAVRDLREPKFSLCREWKPLVFQWFREHPEIQTVFVAGLTGGSGVRPRRRRSRFATAVAGFSDAWRALPPTVRRIIVLRDTPKTRPDVTRCVKRAISRRHAPARACATTRRDSLDADPAIAAARAWRTPRVQRVDLTRYFCDLRLCYPVIGRVLVLRDQHHMTAAYSATLGPILLREVQRLPTP